MNQDYKPSAGEHPITPPPELVGQWCHEDGDEIKTSPRWFQSVCAKAAQWGADQELEACCEWLSFYSAASDARDLRAARRPKPLALLDKAEDPSWDINDFSIIQRLFDHSPRTGGPR